MTTDPSTVSRDDRRDAVRETFVRERGFWAPPFEAILQADAEFLSAYLEFSAAPWRRGPLEPKVKEFIYIAADAAVTHMHAAGTDAHIRSALRHGASREEIVSVLEITSLLGLQSLELGLSVLAANDATQDAELKASTSGNDDWLDLLAQVDPAGAQATRGWRETVRSASPLEPKVIELLGVAVNASTTHLNEAATAQHVRAALAAGASPAEIVEVLELVAVLGIHTATMAMPILMDQSSEGALS